MDPRTRILEATLDLLSAASEPDVATRDVCEAANVAAPAIYRNFGDKEGLLAAVVDYSFQQYLAEKRATDNVDDPVEQIRFHFALNVCFAMERPNLYKLMWSPGVSSTITAAEAAFAHCLEVVERCAARGWLRVSAETATRMLMSASTGASLSIASLPDLYRDSPYADSLCEAVLAAMLLPKAQRRGRRSARASLAPRLAAAASMLRSQLAASTEGIPLTEPEQKLLQQWLVTLADH